MTDDLAELLKLYSELQECSVADQAAKRLAFSNAVHQVAAAQRIDHWRLSGFVQSLWDKQAARDSRRKGTQPTPEGQ